MGCGRRHAALREIPRYTSPMSDTIRPTPRNQFSFSRLKTLHQCPFRYRLRYLKGMKEAFRSIESYLGNTVHEVLEWIYTQRAEGQTPQEGEILDFFDQRWRKDWPDDLAIIRISDSPDHYFRVGREVLSLFSRETLAKDASTTIALEQRYSLPLSERISYTGFADRVGRTEQGRLFVVDYKTSKKEGDPSEFSEGLQAPLYAACAMREEGEDQALAGYHYLRQGSSHWTSLDREQAESILARFQNLAETALDTREFPARPGILCAWCGFNHICTFARIREEFSGGQIAARKTMELGGQK